MRTATRTARCSTCAGDLFQDAEIGAVCPNCTRWTFCPNATEEGVDLPGIASGRWFEDDEDTLTPTRE